jgi:ferredoxin
MRVHIDPDVCQGHGLCHMSAPEVFYLRDEDGQSYVLTEIVPPGQQQSAELAAQACPERAITLTR